MKKLIKIIITIISFYYAHPQETLTSEPSKTNHTTTTNKTNLKIKQSYQKLDTLQLPFYENFKNNYEVSQSKWYKSNNVKILNNGSKLPATHFAILDGSDSLNLPYVPLQQAYGASDTLRTHCINLINNSPQDSIYLSFWIQNGGIYDPAEISDSIIVLFKDTTKYVEVWAKTGEDIPKDSSIQILIPVSDSAFFHKCFQIIFLRVGSLNGQYDNFLIANIYLNKNRNYKDSSYTITFNSTLGKPLKQFYHIPRKHLTASNIDSIYPLQYTYFNNTNLTTPANTKLKIYDKLNNQININNNFPVSFSNKFSDTITIGNTNKINITNNAKIVYELIYNQDTIIKEFRIDSILAYDDGSAEAGYGIFQDQAFGQEFNLNAPDSLRAVYINFFPSQYKFNNKTLELQIWNITSTGPDSIIYKKNIRLQTGKKPNYFHRYTLDSIIPLPNRFLIALRQYDNNPLSVGFDIHSYEKVIWFQQNNVWKRSRLNGVLTIRPELQSGATSKIIANINKHKKILNTKIYPNPTSGIIKINTKTHWKLINLHGKTLLNGYSNIIDISHLPNGLYFLIINNKHHKIIKM